MRSDLLSTAKSPLFGRIYMRDYKEETLPRVKRSAMSKTNLLLILIFTTILSCGKTNQEEVDDALFHARQLLTGGRCAEALEAIAKIPPQPRNADYLKISASGHACIGGYSTPTFFLTDISKVSASQTAFLGSLATFSTSNMTSNASEDYLSLKTAINILLLGGGISASSYSNRSAALGSLDNNNLSVFALYMILVELGKFMNYYGNANDTTGVKGGGSGLNECYMDYTDATAQAGIALQGGDSCDLFNEGGADLNASRTRQCEGIVLFNNFIDIINNVTFSGSNSGSLGSLSTNVTSPCTPGATFNAETCNVKTFSECVDDTTNINNVQIERFYGIIFENMHI